jgi:hypothetical protein
MDLSTVAPAQVDARVIRFTAGVTAAVLATVLLVAAVSVPAAAVLLAVQAAVFAVGAIGGPGRHPYSAAYQKLVAPPAGSATAGDYVDQVRFAQLIGFIVCSVGVAGFALGRPTVGLIAAGFGLVAALARAIFGVCLSRGPYMLVTRMRGKVPVCCQNKVSSTSIGGK